MVQPIDLHVLLNRALELQRIQGVALRQPQDENEAFKNRVAQEITEEERQVRRKREMVDGRIHKEEEGRNRERRERGGERRRNHSHSTAPKRDRINGKGQIVDLEV